MIPHLAGWAKLAWSPFTDPDGFSGSKIWFFLALTNVMVVWNLYAIHCLYAGACAVPDIPYNVVAIIAILGGIKGWSAKIDRDCSPQYARTLAAAADLKSAGRVKTRED